MVGYCEEGDMIKMGQNLMMVCDRCELITFMGCRFYNISKSQLQDYFYDHKGHKIRACGDDSTWGFLIDDLVERGYEKERLKWAWDDSAKRPKTKGSSKTKGQSKNEYIYANERGYQRKNVHVVKDGWAISLITGNKFRYEVKKK